MFFRLHLEKSGFLSFNLVLKCDIIKPMRLKVPIFSKNRVDRIKKILIIGLSSIGDNFLISPAIKLIKEKCKDASIDIVVGPRSIVFVQGNPVFSKYYIWDKKTGIFHLKRILGNNHYDLIIDFRNSPAPFFLKADYRMTFFIKELFSRKFTTHESVRVLKFLEPYFGRCENVELYFPLKDEEILEYKKFFEKNGILDGSKVAMINPGAAFEKKRWGKDRFVEIGRYLISKYDLRVIVSGSSDEFNLADDIRRKINDNNCINLAGKITFRQFAYLLSKSALLITNDTGTMHLGCAMKCPIIAIFGPGNPLRYGPIGTKNIVLHTNRKCFPCRLEAKCDKNFICMEEVTVEMVISAIEKLLN
ncbi:MAG: glycosyltransferase family 9 protein [Candidatus Omnitrophica bacterium]|nr:glycosyltransferase family 9 protein [Candidatus Omnitrophota bacterium]